MYLKHAVSYLAGILWMSDLFLLRAEGQNKKTYAKNFFVFAACFSIIGLLVGCNNGGSSNHNAQVDPPEPSFYDASFSNPLMINNTWRPMVPETSQVYQLKTEDGGEIIVVEVLDETRMVDGVLSRVVRDRVFEDGLLMEDTFDWFAQDDSGNIWYLGEEVINYEYDDDDEVLETNEDGSWESGEDVADVGSNAVAGILIKANPIVGDSYQQEFYEGEAEDMAEVVATNVTVELDNGFTYTGAVQTQEWNPLEPGGDEYKYYAPNLGLVLEEAIVEEERVELMGTFLTGEDRVPDFDAAVFTDPTTVDNTYFPLVPGAIYTYEMETEDGLEKVVSEVLEETTEINGVECRVVRVMEYLDDLLIEDTSDWYAQDDSGNVWYMGEEVINYEYDDEDELLGTNDDGAWETGEDGALAGIIMWANQVVGESYYQEYYEDEAEDMAMAFNLTVTVELSDDTVYDNCLQILEWNPLEPEGVEYKYYAPGVGLIMEEEGEDEKLELVDME